MALEDQIDPRCQEQDELAYRITERDEARAEVLRLLDVLRTIANGELGSVEECISFANTAVLSSQETIR